MGGFHPTPEGFLWFFIDWFNKNVADKDVSPIVNGDAYVVWFNYTLGSAKCLISTVLPDHMYYELTYNKADNCVYVDSYVKVRNMEVNF